MKVLLIWEEIPETIKAYVLEGEEAIIALQCHNKYINSDDAPELDQLSEILENKKPVDTKEAFGVEGADKVVFSGFIL